MNRGRFRLGSIAIPVYMTLAVLLLLSTSTLRSAASQGRRGTTQDADRLQSTTGPIPPPGIDLIGHVFSEARIRAATVIPNVPAYIWRHGCGPTAVGMVVGYYDGQGYDGLIPGNASFQGAAVNAAIASQGNYDDYCLPIDSYQNLLPDRSELPVGDEHPDDSIADFMDTSQSVRSSYYGWNRDSDVTPGFVGYVNLTGAGAGTSAGYWSWTFSYESVRQEIDNLRPLVFLVDTQGDGATDHFVTVIGYNSENGIDYYGCYDTWDQVIHWYEYRAIGEGIPWGVARIHTFQMIPGVLQGALQVTLLPAEAVTDGVQWNVDAGAWQSSGTTISGLSVGDHMVGYRNVSGWVAPAAETVSIANGQTTQLTRTYARAIPAAERSALVALYNSTNGDGWTHNTGWKTPPLHTDGFALPGTEGNWHGLYIASGESPKVEQISLSGNNLWGYIPPEIGALDPRFGVDLSSNRLSGPIPPEITSMDRLLTLNLSSNLLSGSIPSTLGVMRDLVDLNLGNNLLSGSIPVELDGLAGLYYLRLQGNQLSGPIPSDICELADLEYLNLSSNELTGSIPALLSNIQWLMVLDLSGNDLEGGIPSGLGTLFLLQVLDLGGNRLGGTIPPELGDLGNLFSLDLSGNQLSGDIPAALSGLTSLQTGSVDLGYNGLSATDPDLITFLNSKDPDWSSTQTVTPTALTAAPIGGTTVVVSWTAIPYQSDTGGYIVSTATTAGGPYAAAGQTATKSDSSLTITGLAPGTPYYFVVRTRTDAHAHNENVNESPDSPEASAATFAQLMIQGTVRQGSVALPNVVVSGLPGNPVSDALGVYQGLVDAGWTGTVTPTLSGYGFSPPSRSYSGLSLDQMDQDYDAVLIQPRITVTAPNGSEAWQLGTIRYITWTQEGLTGAVTVDLYKGASYLKTLGTSDASSGVLSWAIPAGDTPGTDYRILIWQGSVSDDSDADFALISGLANKKVDFNGDGQEDILWRYYGSGAYQGLNVIWLMNQSGGAPAPIPLKGDQTAAQGTSLLTGMTASVIYQTPQGGWSHLTSVPKKVFETVLDGRTAPTLKAEQVMRDPIDHGHARSTADQERGKDKNVMRIPARHDAVDVAKLGSGTGETASISLGTEVVFSQVLDTGWEIAGTGDFNSDGKIDILWRYYGTGALQGLNDIWFMDGTTFVSEAVFSQVSDLNWRIAGTGDFNGDGDTDILWRYYGTGAYQGLNVIWFMNGSTFAGESVFSQVLDTAWKIAGTGDFNADGKTDILWRNHGTGTYQGLNDVWFMDGTTFVSEAVFSQVTDTAWEIAGTGDFNNDGNMDILWRYYGTGAYQGLNDIWYMNGTTFVSEEVFSQVMDTNWRIVNR